jgi:hypothetical protein
VPIRDLTDLQLIAVAVAAGPYTGHAAELVRRFAEVVVVDSEVQEVLKMREVSQDDESLIAGVIAEGSHRPEVREVLRRFAKHVAEFDAEIERWANEPPPA